MEKLDITARIKAIYNFLRDEIRFGYNVADNIPSSVILRRKRWRNLTSELFLHTLLAIKHYL